MSPAERYLLEHLDVLFWSLTALSLIGGVGAVTTLLRSGNRKPIQRL